MPSFVGRVATVLSLVALAGCSDLTGPESIPLARQLWDAQNRSSYEYVGTRSCFCLGPYGPVTVIVIDNQVVRVVDHNTRAAVPTSGWLTIDAMFEEAERAIEDDRLDEIEFDEREGYPTLIDICCQANDSGITRTVTDLTDVRPIPALDG